RDEETDDALTVESLLPSRFGRTHVEQGDGHPAILRNRPGLLGSPPCGTLPASRSASPAGSVSSGLRVRARAAGENMKKSEERKDSFRNSSGIEIRPLYTERDLQGIDPRDDIGAPGEYPYTRGIQPDMYRSRRWTMRQYAGFGSAKETNRRLKF